ncbi:MAG: hypothetical protein J6U84_06350 [Bacteroidales bacterium]|jgi:hypothetical protein|nr:hypothetical protein [Bacteroidales bacterium]
MKIKEITELKDINLQKNVKDMRSSWGIRIILPFSVANAFVLLVFSFFGLFFNSFTVDFISSTRFPEIMYFWKENLLYFFTPSAFCFVFLFLLSMLSIYSCMLMWFGHKSGVLLYAVSKVGLILVPALFLGYRGFSYGDIMLAVFFIAYYYIYMIKHPIKETNNE